MKILRPYSITAGTIILFALWVWIDTSNADYRAGSLGGGRTTAGWFVLGSPFIFGFAVLVSMLFSLIARRARLWIGWLCLLMVFVPLIVFAFISTTPAARLRNALGVGPPPDTRIERIEEFDSFNEGAIFVGVCSASPSFVQQLITTQGLRKTDFNSALRQAMPDEPIPENANILTGNGLTIYYDTDRSLLYFHWHFDQNRRP